MPPGETSRTWPGWSVAPARRFWRGWCGSGWSAGGRPARSEAEGDLRGRTQEFDEAAARAGVAAAADALSRSEATTGFAEALAAGDANAAADAVACPSC